MLCQMQMTTSPGCWIKSQEPSFWEVMDSFVLLPYVRLAVSRSLFKQLLACMNFPLDLEDWLLVQMEKVISMNYGSSTSNWKPWRWVRLDLILSLMRGIYIDSNLKPITKFTSSTRSTNFKDVILWKISQMITNFLTKIVIRTYGLIQHSECQNIFIHLSKTICSIITVFLKKILQTLFRHYFLQSLSLFFC